MDDSEALRGGYSNRLWKERAPGLLPGAEMDPGTLWVAEDAEGGGLSEKHRRYPGTSTRRSSKRRICRRSSRTSARGSAELCACPAIPSFTRRPPPGRFSPAPYRAEPWFASG